MARDNSPFGERWDMARRQCEAVARKLYRAGLRRRAEAIHACGTQICYYACKECGQIHVSSTERCRDRLCPLCNWRLSIKHYAELAETLRALDPDGHHQTVGMIKVTVRNPWITDLADTLDEMARGGKRMIQSKAWREMVDGYVRAIEVKEGARAGYYHPHYHYLVICRPGYEPGTANGVIANLWQRCMRLDYIPVCDAKNAYCNNAGGGDEGALLAAALECSKYVAKSSDLLRMTDRDIVQVADAIAGRRLIVYGGSIGVKRRELGYTEVERAPCEEGHKCCGREMAAEAVRRTNNGWERAL